jgi:hypothetical protein
MQITVFKNLKLNKALTSKLYEENAAAFPKKKLTSEITLTFNT